jgi:hypothetical protein
MKRSKETLLTKDIRKALARGISFLEIGILLKFSGNFPF